LDKHIDDCIKVAAAFFIDAKLLVGRGASLKDGMNMLDLFSVRLV
jgi:hypothetical protein